MNRAKAVFLISVALVVCTVAVRVAFGGDGAADALSKEDRALLSRIIAANQRLEQASPLDSYYGEYRRTFESVPARPDTNHAPWVQNVEGTFAFERGPGGAIEKIVVEDRFQEGSAYNGQSSAGNVMRTMRLGNTHYSVTITGGEMQATKATTEERSIPAQLYSPWNMLFDFKAEPLMQLDRPNKVRVMVSIDQYWVGPARVTSIRRSTHEGRPMVDLDIDFSGRDEATGNEARIRYQFRLAEDMDFLPVEIRRTREDKNGFRVTGVTTVEEAIQLKTPKGPLWIPARLSDTNKSEGGESKETYELRQKTLLYNKPVPAAVFAFDPTGAAFYYDADARRERERQTKLAAEAYEAKYGAGVRVRAPEFAGAEWYGDAQSLDGLKGKVVLVVFWGKQCGRCIAALPGYQALVKQYGADPFVLVALHCQEADREAVLTLMKENDCHFPVGQVGRELADAYAVDSLPAYYLLDKKGQLVAGRLRELPSAKTIRGLLAE